jgi:UDP-N-acetyl-D-glucosamine dehydrogenase
VKRLMEALNTHRKPLAGSRILVLGVAYKADIDDLRESPAIRTAELLAEAEAELLYHDPFVPEFKADGVDLESVPLDAALLESVDAALIITNHSGVDYDLVVQHAPLIMDTRNALKAFENDKVIRL